MRERFAHIRFQVEPLEERQLLASFEVTTPSDNIEGSPVIPDSLRAAITNSNNTPGLNTICFNIGNGGAQTITLLQPLPMITNPVIINGTTQHGYSGTPLITIEGIKLLSGSGGIVLGSPGTPTKGSIIEGLDVDFCINSGILINSFGNIVENNVVSNTRGDGVDILSGANNTVGGTAPGSGNTISGNSGFGINITSVGNLASILNMVQGNLIGLVGKGNTSDGVNLANTSFNTIGGTVTGAGNTISGNNGNGISLLAGSSRNMIEGNFIRSSFLDGVDLAGTGTMGNTIGGTVAGAGNTISSNNGDGIDLISAASGNMVWRNQLAINSGNGVVIFGGTGNIIGGVASAAGNTILSNVGDGVLIQWRRFAV